MSAADTLLSRLEGARRSGSGRWLARCPAHDDHSPSLSVRELDDGRTLLHCFGGCAVADVVGAIGLTMEDLFPPRDNAPGAGRAPVRRPFSAADLIDLAAWESSVAALIALDVRAGRAADTDRLLEAARRLHHVAEAAHAR
jgi:hypothetical protein